MNRTLLILFLALLLAAAVTMNVSAAGPAGPKQDRVHVCHYCDLHDHYVTLLVGQASAEQHLANHSADAPGPCATR